MKLEVDDKYPRRTVLVFRYESFEEPVLRDIISTLKSIVDVEPLRKHVKVSSGKGKITVVLDLHGLDVEDRQNIHSMFMQYVENVRSLIGNVADIDVGKKVRLIYRLVPSRGIAMFYVYGSGDTARLIKMLLSRYCREERDSTYITTLRIGQLLMPVLKDLDMVVRGIARGDTKIVRVPHLVAVRCSGRTCIDLLNAFESIEATACFIDRGYLICVNPLGNLTPTKIEKTFEMAMVGA